jgi:hypothetical protein
MLTSAFHVSARGKPREVNETSKRSENPSDGSDNKDEDTTKDESVNRMTEPTFAQFLPGNADAGKVLDVPDDLNKQPSKTLVLDRLPDVQGVSGRRRLGL